MKFGISFNLTAFNQAGALVHVYKDGSVLINHGGTEMGQGLHTKMLQVAATALGVPLSAVRLAPTRTDKVPNTSATAASSGADLNGGAVKNACEQIRGRLAEVAAGRLGIHPADVRFDDGSVTGRRARRRPCSTSPSSCTTPTSSGSSCWRPASTAPRACTGTPTRMQGSPFKYFAYGVAAAEVEVDGFTGAYRLRRVDIVHDVGDSLSPLVDLGQIEGGFVQGAGWLTLEDLRWDESDGPARGRLATQAASTYKLPSFSEMPEVFNVALLERATEDGVVYGSKAVGEPPLMLAFCVREALRAGGRGVRAARAQRRPGLPGHAGGRLLGGRGGPGGRQPRGGRRPGRSPRRRPGAGGGADVAPRAGVRTGLAGGRQRLRERAAARRPRHPGGGARPRPARGRGEDGRLAPTQTWGTHRRRQPRGRPRSPARASCSATRGRRARAGRPCASPTRRPPSTASSAAAAR